jgi:SAM-dependent methyltransferase
MSLGYRLAYRIGLTPWEGAGDGGRTQLDGLLDREEQGRSVPFGRAVDLGCGSGAHTVNLAGRGWDVVGVDNVPRALERAQARPGADKARFVLGDVTRLEEAGIEPGVELFVDIGCFHGLDDDGRERYADGVTSLATPTATMLLLAFVRGRGPLPRGATRADLERSLPGWDVVDQEAADTSGMPKPLRATEPQFYRLRRSTT